ncbi:AAA family ATPase [Jeotgalibacillus terrae]|uniref:AAA family ATPase n=1 Tax=Jeotgalibacillus terrae TaxID=587735 RepID=A0ABW5ZHC6_9BACL|nr:AAA family ATPase [Jeotgalibacillus terrae]MBM7579361.1 adenylate kinase family enzyme [Jeotgalibacillus terrae]
MKIRICGAVGSGKTTLARELSKKYQIPYYELDQVVRERQGQRGDRLRSESEKAELLKEIIEQPAWIIEGMHNEEWTYDTFEHADVLCLLNPPKKVIKYRLTKRFIRQKLKLETVHYTPTISIYFKMFKWAKMFDEKGRPNVMHLSETVQAELIILENDRDVKEFLRNPAG